MGSSNNSLISPQILEFYKVNNARTREDLEKYFHPDHTYNFAEIAKLLLPAAENNSGLQAYEYEDYLRCYEKLEPVFCHSLLLLETGGVDFEKSLYLQWLGQNYDYYHVLEKEHTLQRLLLLTAILENALGNVYYKCLQRRKQPPHLLKDLLSTAELTQFFGADAIVFLKVLLGTPRSINLRNIVWHGFPQTHELPSHYVAVLLLSLHSLGGIINAQPDFQLLRRAQIQDFARFLPKLEAALSQPAVPFAADIEAAVRRCHWLAEGHKLLWLQLLCHYQHREYWQFVLLALPQIELLLRLIYSRANDYDIGAKLNEYYITMDSIYECNVPATTAAASARRNQLLLQQNAHLSGGALKFIYDLFAAPQGPRLRDKVGHGEVSMTAINDATLCRILLHLALQLLSVDDTKLSIDAYESVYHLNCLTRAALEGATQQLQQFVRKHLSSALALTAANVGVSSAAVKIFDRPKREAELMQLLLKIAQYNARSIANYEDALVERLALLAQRELHSRRRRTLEQQQGTLPRACKTLDAMLLCLRLCFRHLQGEAPLFDHVTEVERLVRFLKHSLQIAENFAKYSHKESNEWIRVLELCEKFSTHRQRLFPWPITAS